MATNKKTKACLVWGQEKNHVSPRKFVRDTTWILSHQHVADTGTAFLVKAGNKLQGLTGATDAKSRQTSQLQMFRKYRYIY